MSSPPQLLAEAHEKSAAAMEASAGAAAVPLADDAIPQDNMGPRWARPSCAREDEDRTARLRTTGRSGAPQSQLRLLTTVVPHIICKLQNTAHTIVTSVRARFRRCACAYGRHREWRV